MRVLFPTPSASARFLCVCVLSEPLCAACVHQHLLWNVNEKQQGNPKELTSSLEYHLYVLALGNCALNLVHLPRDTYICVTYPSTVIKVTAGQWSGIVYYMSSLRSPVVG